MRKKIRKNTQLSLINLLGAGRPRIHDPGIAHRKRPILSKASSLHLTIKLKRIKAEMKNKAVLTLLKRAILNARKKGLRIIHFTLEYDHVHLLVEAANNHVLGRGMQSFGVTLSKAINRLRNINGEVYKHRYHFRKINSSRELRIVMNYIFSNGVKHKTAMSLANPFNSIRAEMKYKIFYKGKLNFDRELINLLDQCRLFYRGLDYC
jgi:REP element-mobilizing transposase RayT